MSARRASLRALGPLVVALMLAAPGAAGAQQRVEVGSAASVTGEVSIEAAGTARPAALRLRQKVAWGDVIATKAKAQAQLLLLDRSSFGIGERTRLKIDRYVYDPGRERSFVATLLKGALRFLSGSEAGLRSGEIATPAGRIGIRGTALDALVGEGAAAIAGKEPALARVRADKASATLVVLRGPAAGAASGLAPGRAEVSGAGVTVVLQAPGEAAFIPRAGAAPIGPFRLGNAGLLRVHEQISPAWARSFKSGGLGKALLGAAAVAAVATGVLIATDDDDRREGGQQPTGLPRSDKPTDRPTDRGPDRPR